MRVVVQNLFGRRADWPKRRAVLAQALRELEPDLVAFPEATAPVRARCGKLRPPSGVSA